MLDLTPFKAARLGPSDLSRLLGVNRSTVSMWMNGHFEPCRIIAPRTQRLIDAVKAATAAGTLPVPANVRRSERAAYLASILPVAVA